MRQFFLAVLLIANVTYGYSQTIAYYDNLSLALLKAKELNKPVFISIEPPSAAMLKAHNAVHIKSGLEDADVAHFYNKNFINLKIIFTDTSYNSFKKLFPIKIDNYPGYVFLDSSGELMHREGEFNVSSPSKCIEIGQVALRTANSGKTITDYKKLLKKGKLSREHLKQYIILRQSLGLYDDFTLIDEYVNQLTVQSFNSYDEVLFILKSGPIVNSKTYNLCYTNRKLIDSIYKTQPRQICKEINNRIITNTRKEAISKKNPVLARQLSQYVQGTWQNDYQRGAKAAASELMFYYQSVKDTANYYRQATYFYDTYYMRISSDSVKKLKNADEAAINQAMINRLKQINPNAKVVMGANQHSIEVAGRNLPAVTSAIVSGGTLPLDVPGVLNNAAYSFYTSGTHNLNYLTKALLWVKRSIELSSDNHAPYDTMAHLLYRMGFVDEAVVNQKKAIEMAKKERISNAASYIPKLENELVKMQERKL